MEAYRRRLLAERGGAPVRGARGASRQAAPPRRAPQAAPLQGRGRELRGAGGASSRRCATTIDARLANPLLYARGDGDEIETLQRKRAEVVDGARPRRGAVDGGAGAARGGGRARSDVGASRCVTTFVTLFVVIDPVALAPLFVALTRGMTAPSARRHRAARGR